MDQPAFWFVTVSFWLHHTSRPEELENKRCSCSVQQSLRYRLARSALSPFAWPDHPVPIALVITDLDVGGAERALVSLAVNLNRQRWQPMVFCLDQPGRLVDVLLNANVPCACLEVQRGHAGQAIARLARALRQFKPQLVQSFMFHANLGDPSCRALGGFSVGCWRFTCRRASKAMAFDFGSPHRCLEYGLGVCFSGCFTI